MTTKVLNKIINICKNLNDEITGRDDTDHIHDSSYASIDHTHEISEVIDLQDTLNSKAENEHTHKMSDITDLSIDLSGVASIDHTHSISEITNLQTTLDAKAASSHSHAISDVSNLQTNLDSKSDSSHTHKISSLTDYKSELLELIYPVGSVYISMNFTSPADLFGGTWERLGKDRFLISCGDESEPGFTGGSFFIEEKHLPAHTHTFTGIQATDTINIRGAADTSQYMVSSGSNGLFSATDNNGNSSNWSITTEKTSCSWDTLTWTYTPEGTLSETGQGAQYTQPFVIVVVWYRTA